MDASEVFVGNVVPYTGPEPKTISRDTDSSSLEELAVGATEKILMQIAGHPNCSAILCARLARHDAESVRCAVAGSANLDECTVWLLSYDQSAKVRCRLAGNATIPVFALEALSEDELDAVAKKAERTLATLARGSSFGNVIYRLFKRELKQTG